MTAHAIHRNPHPMRSAMPLLPMSQEQARFWNLFHSRRLAAPADGNNATVEARSGKAQGNV